MILSGKRSLNSPVNNGQISGVQTPLTAKKKIKTKKEAKQEVVVVTAAATQASASASALASALNHSRKLSDNRLCQLGIASGFSPDRIYGERHISNNSPNSQCLARKEGQNYEMRSYVYQQQEQKQSHGGDGEEGERFFHQQYEGNQDIKNKLISLLTSKNESKKLVSSKSSGNSLDFAVGEFGRRKKSPQNVENNQNSNFPQSGGYAHHQSQQYLSKKSPSNNSKNLLYFQEKPLGLTSSSSKTQQIHSGSSTHYALSPKEPKNIKTILQQAHERSTREKQLYSFSPHLNALLKSKKLSPEKRESLSPEQEHLTKIIVQQKSSSSNISALNSRSGVSPSAAENKQQHLSAAAVPSALKKKSSTAKAQVGYILNGGNTRTSNPSNVEPQKHDNSKERIINLLNQKQEGHCSPLNQPLPSKEYNARKNSTVSKKTKSVSPEGQQSSLATAKGILNRTAKKGSPQSRPLTNQCHQTQTKKAFFKKARPPELEEVPSANTISQSVPNSSKNNLSQHPPFHTPSHIGNGQRDQQQKKFYFDSGSVSSKNSQLLHSHTVNTTSLQVGNTFNLHHSQLNPNNQSASAVNHSNSARSSNHPAAPNPIYQNYLYQFLHGAEQLTPNSNQLNNHAPSPSYNNSQNNLNILNSSLKNAENKLMKIQEDIQEGEQSNGSQQFSERLQKTFLRTSKLLTGYKTRELNWEHEKRALVDEIKFLKNLLYTEQFDDIIKDGD